MSVTLNCSSNIHDTFLHVSPALYMKIFAQMTPLVQLSCKDNFTFWCIKDPSLSDNVVTLNLNFAENLGLKSGEHCKISVGPFNCVDLSKVVISLPNVTNDWTFLHENYEKIQTLILDQIRLIKRGNQYPIYASIRKLPLWIKIEEFGGYQPSHKLGIISEDTELVLIDNESVSNVNFCYSPIFMAVPHTSFDFLCSSGHKLPQICSFKDHSFKVRQLDTIPQNIIFIPDVILRDIFKLRPKTKIFLSLKSNFLSKYSNICHYSIDGSKCLFIDSEHPNETIISTSNGVAVKMPELTSDTIIRVRNNDSKIFNKFTEILHNSSHRFILFHGPAGSGKTEMVLETMDQLNYSKCFPYQIIYIDLLTSDFRSNMYPEIPALFIFDHVDEYFQLDSENDDEKSIRRYINIYRGSTELLLQKEVRIAFISRSTKPFSYFSKISLLPFDFIYSFEQSKTWNFTKKSEPLISVHGLHDALKSLERHILNPLQFSNIYHKNHMKLYSSVLISGPSGSGKTFLAQRFIEHYKITCISVRGPEILDKYVGSSEKGVRDLFSKARELKPCVIFFDEIDSLVPRRGSNQSGVTDRIVNQFLTELDGTEDRSGIFIIATTSRPDLIDKAILRPGRIDQRIELAYPSLDEIKQFIIGKGIKHKKLKPLLDFIKSNPDINISWADLVSADWNDPNNSISDLMKSLQVPIRTQYAPPLLNTNKPLHKLSLA